MRGVTIAVCAASLAALLPASALAGVVSKPDRTGDIKAKGLSGAERRALDIASLGVRGDESSGLFVTVRFRGNIERYLGQGHLKHALVALVLQPKSSGQAPAGLVTTGGGFSRRRIVFPKRTRRGFSVKRRVIKRFGRERVLRRTGSRRVGVIRRKNQLLFFIRGPGLSNVGAVQVRAYAKFRGRARRARAAQTPPRVPRLDWLKILDNKENPTDLAGAGVDPSALDCVQLKGLRAELAKDRAYHEKHQGSDEAILRSYKKAVADYSMAAYNQAKARGEPYATKAELQDVVDTFEEVVRREKAIQAIGGRLISQLDALIKNCNNAPVINSFSAVFGTYCATCTLYTVNATDPEGQPLTYSWSKSPPPGSTNPGATNCGTFIENSPAANQAVWDHPNEGSKPCSHAAGEHPGHITVVVTDARGAQALFTDTRGSAKYP